MHLIDQVLPYLNSSVKYISLGNEVDTYFSTYRRSVTAYKALIEDARNYIHQKKPNIKVGVTTTFDGFTAYPKGQRGQPECEHGCDHPDLLSDRYQLRCPEPIDRQHGHGRDGSCRYGQAAGDAGMGLPFKHVRSRAQSRCRRISSPTLLQSGNNTDRAAFRSSVSSSGAIGIRLNARH